MDISDDSIDDGEDQNGFIDEEDINGHSDQRNGQKSNRTIEETYVKLEQDEHILARPDMYIGSTSLAPEERYIYASDEEGMVLKTITYAPGLYKIFDEILVNAADNYQRDPKMKYIKVNIDKENNTITVENDGDGIPVEIHEKHKKYVPELIFGDLLTGSNFDDTVNKVTGGRNGLGAKLANIYSLEFTVETVQKNKKFKQTYYDNMKRRTKPEVSTIRHRDYTRITFKPDLKRFNMTELDDDIIALMKKRVYDVAGCNSSLKVYLNDEPINIKSFKDYCMLYFKNKSFDQQPNLVYERIMDDEGRRRWEVAFAVSDGEFRQVSFVNSIWTIRGGTHVTAILKKISDYLVPRIKRKNKGTEVKPAQIKNHVFLFVNSLINNPEFDSQTKETLKLTPSQWGTKCDLSEQFFKKVATSGIIDQILTWNQGRTDKQLKTTSGRKQRRIVGISKLNEANNAGTSKSKDCTLILIEGDSAKGLAVAGLSVVGRDYYGIFPLRGKFLNVRDASAKTVIDNEEINNIKQILGLQHDKVYHTTDGLRYGHLMIMTDQDHDGSHIKGLLINFFHHFWPSLLKIPNFLMEFVTPIVKATKGDQSISFFTIPEYEAWKEKTNLKGWKIKYYKGLGTSQAREMQEYFSDLPKHRKYFKYVGPEDDEAIVMAFSKQYANKRKNWISNYEQGTYLDQSLSSIPYNEFINKELILFSLADCERSIPSLVDGFKPGQRKILFSCFKRNLKGEIKVAQLSGYVSEHSAYHHGEQSLHATIIGMAQNFVGSNNINLLEPIGGFGTRDMGGKDASAARYIHTTLSVITRYIFHPDDDNILDYLNEEGLSIQPVWYMPVIPMVLVNGSSGIGTGWSSTIPNYNPRDIVNNIRRLLRNEDTVKMKPWYRGFLGSIEEETPDRYKVKGIWRRVSHDCIEVTELPIRKWTQDYKDFLEGLLLNSLEKEKVKKMKERKRKRGSKDEEEESTNKKANEEPFIKDYKEYHTNTRVHFKIYSDNFAEMTDSEIEAKFKLTTTISLTNMHLFATDGKIKRYREPEDIIKEFFVVRLKYYQLRKDYLVKKIEDDFKILSNKVRFILAVINKEIVISNRKRADIINDLIKKGFDPIKKEKTKPKQLRTEILAEGEDEEDEENEPTSEDDKSSDYDYLLSMQLWSLTLERVNKLKKQLEEKEDELRRMKSVHPADLWERDLDAFEEAWNIYENNMDILDKVGVGGSAFLGKPTGIIKGVDPKKQKENTELLKGLKKLAPNKGNVVPPERKEEREEIILPEIKAEPFVFKEEPVKAKRGSKKAIKPDPDGDSKDIKEDPIKPDPGKKKTTAKKSSVKKDPDETVKVKEEPKKEEEEVKRPKRSSSKKKMELSSEDEDEDDDFGLLDDDIDLSDSDDDVPLMKRIQRRNTKK